MLSDIRPSNSQFAQVPVPSVLKCAAEDRYSRNVQEDMKEAIDLLYKFKASLDKLHPDCIRLIEGILITAPSY